MRTGCGGVHTPRDSLLEGCFLTDDQENDRPRMSVLAAHPPT